MKYFFVTVNNAKMTYGFKRCFNSNIESRHVCSTCPRRHAHLWMTVFCAPPSPRIFTIHPFTFYNPWCSFSLYWNSTAVSVAQDVLHICTIPTCSVSLHIWFQQKRKQGKTAVLLFVRSCYLTLSPFVSSFLIYIFLFYVRFFSPQIVQQ